MQRRHDVLAGLDSLAAVCDEGTRVVVIGRLNDVVLYRELVRLHKEEGLDFAHVVSFNLDEYFGLDRDALQSYHRWMREHFEDSDGVGAIFPPMIYTAIALRCLGVPDDAPEFAWAMKQLDDLMIGEGDTLRLQRDHTLIALCRDNT